MEAVTNENLQDHLLVEISIQTGMRGRREAKGLGRDRSADTDDNVLLTCVLKAVFDPFLHP